MTETREIPLSDGRVTIVDAVDYDWLIQHKWQILRNNTIKRGERRGKKVINFFMARQIMNAPDGMDVDHINGNRLDNRRCNLRLCNHRDNCRNRGKTKVACTSKYKGVCLIDNRWQAYIYRGRTRTYLGNFIYEVDAAQAYDEAARKYFGEFARLNFPNKPDDKESEHAAANG